MTLPKSCAEVLDEMLDFFEAAPPPDSKSFDQVSIADLAAAEAVGVIYGWTFRVLQSAQACMMLHEGGFTAELPPLMRSMLEHALALVWAADQPSLAFQSLVRERQRQLQKLKEAEPAGWAIDAAANGFIDQMLAVETDVDSRASDTLLAIKHQAERYGQGTLFQAWLIETWSSHPSLVSASDYYELRANLEIALLAEPRPQFANVAAQCVIPCFVALQAYSAALPQQATLTLTKRLQRWDESMAALLGHPDVVASGSDASKPGA